MSLHYLPALPCLSYRFLCLLLLSISCVSCSPSEEKVPDKPNILFIFADDQTSRAIHALGNRTIITPHLDRLVASGVSFTNAYNMGAWNGAVCTASRTMLISGKSVWRANAFRKHWEKGDSLMHSWPQWMAKAGYQTYMSGKWHVNAPAPELFGEALHIRKGMPGDQWNNKEMYQAFNAVKEAGGGITELAAVLPTGYNRPLGPEDHSWSPTDSSFGGYWEGGIHWSEVLRNDALGFFDKVSNSSDPFFMYLAFNAGHDPRQAPQQYQDLYPLEDIPLPESWLPAYPYQLEMGGGPTLRDEALAPFPRTEYATKVHLKEYYAILTHMDEQIGIILDKLEASGKADNTYIIFTSDHGLAVGNHGLLGKQNLFEHSAKAPLIMVGPGLNKGATVDAPVYLQDLMPTSMEMAGIPIPNDIEFQSLLNIAQGDTSTKPYNAIYAGYIKTQRMIRMDGYKLIVYPRAEKVLLFDLKQDPHEIHDLSTDSDQQDRLTQLFQELMAMQEELEDELDLSGLFSKIIQN